MKRFRATVHIFIKPAVLNPEEGPMRRLINEHFSIAASKVSKRKCIIIEFESTDEATARQQLLPVCEKFLINPVVETFEIVSILQIENTNTEAVSIAA
jgi:phosphoribosylformylglycinamidine synthase PurS subunit